MRLPVIIVLAAALLVVGCARKEAALDPAGAGPVTTPPPDGVAPPELPAPLDGAALYAQHCATCHMADGTGVPFMQPSLRDSAILAGDENLLMQVILRGPVAVLPADREPYSNTMPDFSMLPDAEIAAVLNYARREFAGASATITKAGVVGARSGP